MKHQRKIKNVIPENAQRLSGICANGLSGGINPGSWLITMSGVTLLFFAMPASAQDSYTPPPMFDAPAMNAQVGENVLRRFEARRSPYQAPKKPTDAVPPEQKYTGENNPLLPPVVTQGDPALEKKKPLITPTAPRAPQATGIAKAPIPLAKPQITQPKASPPEKPVIAAPAPVSIETPKTPDMAKPAKPDAMPAARVTSKGVVTGPKTMPSVPTGSVIAETTFEETAGNEPTLMERHQAAALDDTPPAPVPSSDNHAPAPPAAVSAADTLTLAYERGSNKPAKLPLEGIIQALNDDPSTRLIIDAYSGSTDQGVNSDRRLSLARALIVRKSLIEKGIAPYRIDIRAHGRKVPDGSPERVDLSISKS